MKTLQLVATLAFTIIAGISLIGCCTITYKVCTGNYEETHVNIALLATYGLMAPIYTIEYVTKAWKRLKNNQ
jgi:hypothetical protein